MNNLSWKRLTNLTACFACAAMLAGCDAVQHRGASSSTAPGSDLAAQGEAAIDVSGMGLSEARLNDVEIRHFAAYRSYVAVADTSAIADDPRSNADAIQRISEELTSGSSASLACVTRGGM
ncbi:MAG TPA: hypothetical protein VGU61_12785 [Noviherbaspirillum sp.]|uniref:hypothetical protein n=1 Tax=Noviherbaspirillum sp. TaxID=1926288 RepID=UPI002DDCDF26|nr:hypothetical protein [Noviherbaspirillum sp.]HEV2611138.1 hypothetical protein [Noviherbaspirillum sp.]